MFVRLFQFLFLFAAIFSCSPPEQKTTEKPKVEPPANVSFTTLLGAPLPEKLFSDAAIQKDFEQKLTIAKNNLDQYPDSLDLIIWYGRRLAYLGKHEEAIDIYRQGLEKFPESHRLKRHIGHRFITTRQLELAIKELGEAARISMDRPNAIEPDGLPNALNVPLGNDKFNIWYHFGLAHYLGGNYDRALEAYQECMTFSDNDDLKAATSYWLYMSAVKTKSNTIAEKTLQNISTSWEMIENEAYMDMLLMFKGIMSPEVLLEKATNEDSTLNPTYAYGIGFHYQKMQQSEKASAVFEKALEGPSWESFGFIACEAEKAR